MMRHFTIVALTALFGLSHAPAQERPVPVDKIPPAVMNALKARFPTAKIDTCVRDTEGGDIIYDIEFHEDGHKAEADIRADGTYINFEKAIEPDALPKLVRDVVDKRYPKASFKEVMEETEVEGKLERRSAYEIVLVTSRKAEVEVRVSPDGKILEDTGAKPPAKK